MVNAWALCLTKGKITCRGKRHVNMYRPCRKNSRPKGSKKQFTLTLLPEPIASVARIIHDVSVQL